MTDLQYYRIPLDQFDLSLLPAGCRDLGTKEFADSLIAHFVEVHSSNGRRAFVNVDDETIDVIAYSDRVDGPPEEIHDASHIDRIRGAIQRLEQLAYSTPADPALLYTLGVAHWEIGEFPQAITRLSSVVEIDSDHVNALIRIGWAYDGLGDSDQAGKFLHRADNVGMVNADALRNLGAFYARQGIHDGAVYLYRSAVTVAPNDAAAMLRLVDSLQALSVAEGNDDADAEADRMCIHLLCRFPRTSFASEAKRARAEIAQRALQKGVPRKACPDVVMYLLSAMKTFERQSVHHLLHIAREIEVLSENGIDIHDPTRKYRLQSLPGDYSALHLMTMMYAAFKQIDPSREVGIDFVREHEVVLAIKSCPQ